MWLAWKKYWVKWSPTLPKNYHNTSWHTINWTRTSSESYYSLSLFVSDYFMIHANFLWLNVGLLRGGFPMKGQPAGWCARCVCALASSWLASHCLEAPGKIYPTNKKPNKTKVWLGLGNRSQTILFLLGAERLSLYGLVGSYHWWQTRSCRKLPRRYQDSMVRSPGIYI